MRSMVRAYLDDSASIDFLDNQQDQSSELTPKSFTSMIQNIMMSSTVPLLVKETNIPAG